MSSKIVSIPPCPDKLDEVNLALKSAQSWASQTMPATYFSCPGLIGIFSEQFENVNSKIQIKSPYKPGTAGVADSATTATTATTTNNISPGNLIQNFNNDFSLILSISLSQVPRGHVTIPGLGFENSKLENFIMHKLSVSIYLIH